MAVHDTLYLVNWKDKGGKTHNLKRTKQYNGTNKTIRKNIGPLETKD